MTCFSSLSLCITASWTATSLNVSTSLGISIVESSTTVFPVHWRTTTLLLSTIGFDNSFSFKEKAVFKKLSFLSAPERAGIAVETDPAISTLQWEWSYLLFCNVEFCTSCVKIWSYYSVCKICCFCSEVIFDDWIFVSN